MDEKYDFTLPGVFSL